MSEIAQQDIAYQPATKEFSYSSDPQQKKKKLNNIFVLLLYLILSLSLLFLFTVFILNYFNFLSISSMYPKIFGFLPHTYNIAATQKALSNVQFSADSNQSYNLEGYLVGITSNKVSIDYNGKLAEFIFGTDLACGKEIVTKLSNDNEQMQNTQVFCSDMLKNENINKKVDIIYQKSPQGFYVLRTTSIIINN